MSFINKRSENSSYIKSFIENGNTNIVNEKTIMNIPSVSSAIELISSTISMLDIGLYKQIRCNKIEEIEQDSRLYKLNIEPNTLMNSTQLKKAITQDMLIHGVNYINIDKSNNNLYYVRKQDVSVLLDTNIIHKDAKLRVGTEEFNVWDFIIPTLNSKNGVQGEGILARNSKTLALALLEQEYINKAYKNGGSKRGFFTTESKLGEKAFDEFKKSCRDYLSGEDMDMIFNKGMDYKTINSNNVEMQVQESRIQLDKELRGIFNIPNEISSEDGYKSFIKLCIIPLINSIENAITKSLLTQTEKSEGYKFKFKLNELTRASLKERFEAYKIACQSGFLTLNEVRAEENMESLEALDITTLSLGNVILDVKTGQYYVPNMDAKVDLKKIGVDIDDKKAEE